MSREVGGVIGKEITVRGEISGREDLLVQGVIEGTVRLEAELIVGEGGLARADVDVRAITVEGQFDGNVKATEVATLRAGSNVTGTIGAPRVVIEEDALFCGHLNMDVGLEPGEGING
jgi:cytoskeletal protein CcmA (bactofilin family)